MNNNEIAEKIESIDGIIVDMIKDKKIFMGGIEKAKIEIRSLVGDDKDVVELRGEKETDLEFCIDRVERNGIIIEALDEFKDILERELKQ